jgi:hypothetical protein
MYRNKILVQYVSGRCVTGIVHMINKTYIEWFSKKLSYSIGGGAEGSVTCNSVLAVDPGWDKEEGCTVLGQQRAILVVIIIEQRSRYAADTVNFRFRLFFKFYDGMAWTPLFSTLLHEL